MINPFETLGIKPTATAEEVRRAYHQMAKKYHPDKFQDPEQQKQAQSKMTAVNLAYEEAMRLASARASSPYMQEITCDDAIKLSAKMLKLGHVENALRELMRSTTRNAAWFHQQGLVLMEMEQYESAHQSFREAVRRDPYNNIYRRGALAAAVALKESRSLKGRIRKALHIKKRK